MVKSFSPTRYDSCELCEDLGETCRHCASTRRSSVKRFWHWILVYIGLRPCCDKQDIVSRISTPGYYLYECLNCGNMRSGGGIGHHL